jgi:hypothetical protein
MERRSYLPSACEFKCFKLKLNVTNQNIYGKGKAVYFWINRSVLVCCLLLIASIVSAQEKKDSTLAVFQFSGTLSLTSNAISPIPAFSLEKPAILGFLSLRKRRFSYDPEMAFSIKGVPWFLNNCFRYQVVDKTRFKFRTGLIWGVANTYPEVIKNGVNRTITQAERFIWLELMPKYKISEKVAFSSTIWSGYNFDPGSVKRINFISLIGNFTKVPLKQNFYFNFFPQVFYLTIDGISDGFFVSGNFGIGHTKLPIVLSSQINQTLTTTLSPDPGFKWNVSLSYSF